VIIVAREVGMAAPTRSWTMPYAANTIGWGNAPEMLAEMARRRNDRHANVVSSSSLQDRADHCYVDRTVSGIDRRRRNRAMATIRFRLTAIILAVAAMATPALAAKKDNSVRYAVTQVLDHADPYFNSVRIGFVISQQVWDTLIYRDPKTNEYRGLLATAWHWIDDRTIELELRRGVKFHNGAEFDADDVVYTLNFAAATENKVVIQQFVNWIDRVEKLDKYKVRIVAKRPFPAAIEYLASRLVIHPHEYYAKVGPKGMNEKPIGSGPYRFVEHAIGKYVRLERNPDYFRDGPKTQPQVDKIEIRFIPEEQTEIAEILSGGLDMIINVAPDQAQQIRNNSALQVVAGETMRIDFLQLNTTEKTAAPQLRDIRVRKAIFHAINRAAMVNSIVGEGATVLHTMCFPTQFGCTDEGAPRYAYDPAKAKQLLAEAGLANGFSVDLNALPRGRDQTEAIAGYLRQVGINARTRIMQYPALRDASRAGNSALVHQSWGSDSINDVSASTSVFYKLSADDINRDKEVSDLLEIGDFSLDPQVRRGSYAKALALIEDHAYTLPLYSLPTYYVANNDLVFTAYPDEIPRFWEMFYK
jgi:peptide/nickel transport system substrate-binding protein